MVSAVGSTHFCAGSILNEDWVVTAAHCCSNSGLFFMHAVAGGVNLNWPENEEEYRDVAKKIIHEDFDLIDVRNDICLLKPLEETEADTMSVVAGWGVTHEGGLLPSTHLKKTSVP